jgi:hypothetical protein
MATMSEEGTARNSLKDFFDTLLPAYARAPLPSKLLRKCVTGVNTTWGRPPSVCRLLEHFQNGFLRNTQGDQKLRWWKNDKELLIFVVCKYLRLDEASNQLTSFPLLSGPDWEALSLILGLSPFCLERQWKLLIHQSVREATWTPEEDTIIRDEVAKFKSDVPNWTYISDLIVQTTENRLYRTPKQVRARWFNYIDPSINKKEWTPEEDKLLLIKVLESGKKWASIAYFMGDRNENQVKNRYHHITKKWTALKSEVAAEFPPLPQATAAAPAGGATAAQNAISSNPNNDMDNNNAIDDGELPLGNSESQSAQAEGDAADNALAAQPGAGGSSKKNSQYSLNRELALVRKILERLKEGRIGDEFYTSHRHDLTASDEHGAHAGLETLLNSGEGNRAATHTHFSADDSDHHHHHHRQQQQQQQAQA